MAHLIYSLPPHHRYCNHRDHHLNHRRDQAECLPKNAEGEAANAGRDVTITILFTFAPGIVMPIFGGALFEILPSKKMAYEVLLLWWLLTAIVALFFLVVRCATTAHFRHGIPRTVLDLADDED